MQKINLWDSPAHIHTALFVFMGKPRSIKDRLSPAAKEIYEWLKENVKGKIHFDYDKDVDITTKKCYYYFEHSNEAVNFKLKWC